MDWSAVDALVSERRHSHVLQSPLAPGVSRSGIMLHYDDSSRDDWAVEWFSDPRCTNGYTWLALDSGRVVQLADPALRTPHAGACRTPNANSAFYGIAAATNGVVPVTPDQFNAIVALCAAISVSSGWSPASLAGRVVGHDTEAIWTPDTTRTAGYADARGSQLWGKIGRKADPTGTRPDRQPVLSVAAVAAAVTQPLQSRS